MKIGDLLLVQRLSLGGGAAYLHVYKITEIHPSRGNGNEGTVQLRPLNDSFVIDDETISQPEDWLTVPESMVLNFGLFTAVDQYKKHSTALNEFEKSILDDPRESAIERAKRLYPQPQAPAPLPKRHLMTDAPLNLSPGAVPADNRPKHPYPGDDQK